MPRSPLAYLTDIVEACGVIELALRGVDLERYQRDPVVRSAVERQLIIIGEAVGSLSALDESVAGRISSTRMIVGLRNRLAHDYISIDDRTVWGIAQHDVPILQRECQALLEALGGAA